MGMAANPSGAHQAGRVFAGRINLGGVSACVGPRAGTPEAEKAAKAAKAISSGYRLIYDQQNQVIV